jgi:hypothetical protein
VRKINSTQKLKGSKTNKLDKIGDYERKVKTVMVNNSADFNKTNNHLFPKIFEL